MNSYSGKATTVYAVYDDSGKVPRVIGVFCKRSQAKKFVLWYGIGRIELRAAISWSDSGEQISLIDDSSGLYFDLVINFLNSNKSDTTQTLKMQALNKLTLAEQKALGLCR